jgi:ribosomal protein S18 acetylase RimI-like enzyme
MNDDTHLITISEALPSDAEGIFNVQTTTWTETYPNKECGITEQDIRDKINERSPQEEIERIRKNILENKPHKKTFVARQDGIVIGFCSIIQGPDFNQLKTIYILPEHQSKGTGKRLWAMALEYIKDNNNNVIVLVATYNQKAIAFYKRLGFKETGKQLFDERFRMKSGSIIPETELILER